jgi:very-short-patch-repair endonuclease
METLCYYGCGEVGKYIIGSKQRSCCSKTYQGCPETKRKNSERIKAKYKEPEYAQKMKQAHSDKPAWNRGKTKENSESVRQAANTLKEGYDSGRLVSPQLGKPLTEDAKQKISDSMKIAHEEGRAWNIGKSRWNNEQSYPEKFFSKVIENEFVDKEYETEFNVGIYSIDFAWVSKKLAIEIDGQQHEKKKQKESDLRKDKLLEDKGWKVLRIKWKDMYDDPKRFIKIAKDFIEQ